MNISLSRKKINEDIYVAQVMMNRKVCRFVTQAINHYWESHYCDDEVEWDDLKYIFEQIKSYGMTTLRYETCPKCHTEGVVYGDDWGCDNCGYWYDSSEDTKNV